MHVDALSKKWLAYCEDLLCSGPIVATHLDGPLDSWSVECTAGKCNFSIGGRVVYACAILRSGGKAAELQNQQLLDSLSSPAWQSVRAQAPDERPLFIVMNLFPEGVSSKDSEAMFQLAYHFAAAYLNWFEDGHAVS
ncbi:hypothetical protein VLK31_35645 [Variovorax sp. H27-G14]|uniref:hypothetical protein n=1 Tax=Variovorax sp. H27-G14 TaxID=3111914 RepID=UPI0038FC5F3B